MPRATKKALESKFQSDLIKDLKDRFPGCEVLKNDPNYIQGFPDLLILHESKWAALEVKRSDSSDQQPNQDYYVGKLNGMSYASFVSPENKEEVFSELQQALRAPRQTRNTKRQ